MPCRTARATIRCGSASGGGASDAASDGCAGGSGAVWRPGSRAWPRCPTGACCGLSRSATAKCGIEQRMSLPCARGSPRACGCAEQPLPPLPVALHRLPAWPASCVPQVALDVQHHQTMAALQQRVSSRERIVGWFSTGDPDASRRYVAARRRQTAAAARLYCLRHRRHAGRTASSSGVAAHGTCRAGRCAAVEALPGDRQGSHVSQSTPWPRPSPHTACPALWPLQPRRPHPLLLRPGVPQPGASGAGHERAGRAHGRARLCVPRAVRGRARAGTGVPRGGRPPCLAGRQRGVRAHGTAAQGRSSSIPAGRSRKARGKRLGGALDLHHTALLLVASTGAQTACASTLPAPGSRCIFKPTSHVRLPPAPPPIPQVDCEVRAGEAERVGTDLLTSELADRLPGDMEGLAESFERLQHSLQQAQEYVDAVVVSGALAAGSGAGQRGLIECCRAWAGGQHEPALSAAGVPLPSASLLPLRAAARQAVAGSWGAEHACQDAVRASCHARLSLPASLLLAPRRPASRRAAPRLGGTWRTPWPPCPTSPRPTLKRCWPTSRTTARW